ncbi:MULTISPECIES: hypothetical protein [unclassified Novosphingobium]|uniref:hypothetical protein n=1 Tax=unclassified Novosphingobium TaxID=2644732 RepID=UPI00146ECDFB|nr:MULTISPECIES: hypothetical protein [unclassified Novosphingobium]NMN06597.1 hypothetical protein [Novosphingobium sp. SG919]NMN88953.1 hypothetical protein [Novosphingobium sp. SG916]
MMTWLMRAAAGSSVLDSLLVFQITGSPVPALLALAAPILHSRLPLKENDHV